MFPVEMRVHNLNGRGFVDVNDLFFEAAVKRRRVDNVQRTAGSILRQLLRVEWFGCS